MTARQLARWFGVGMFWGTLIVLYVMAMRWYFMLPAIE